MSTRAHALLSIDSLHREVECQVSTYANQTIVEVIDSVSERCLITIKFDLDGTDSFQSDLYAAYDTLSNQIGELT